MNCPNCGNYTPENIQYCPNCGCSLIQNTQGFNARPAEVDKKSIGCNILSFFVPIVGLIFWLIWKDEYPIKAKSCGKSALISVILSVVVSILMFALFIGSTLLITMSNASLVEAGNEIANTAMHCCVAL